MPKNLKQIKRKKTVAIFKRWVVLILPILILTSYSLFVINAQEITSKQNQDEVAQHSVYTIGTIISLSLVVILTFYILKSRAIRKNSETALNEKNKELQRLNEKIKKHKNLSEKQRDLAIRRQTEITDSINYARKIQEAVLPKRKLFVELVPDYFIYLKPKDIVSGDFYWMRRLEKHIIIAVADCTGHGVPGAFMSLLGMVFLNEIVDDQFSDPASILNQLRERIIKAMKQTWQDDQAKDGMDISLNIINIETKALQYAGSYLPLYHIRGDELIELKPDKMPVGLGMKEPRSFTNQYLQLKENDKIYLFTDGYIHQFGGENGEKYNSSQFKELLLEINKKPMKEQKELIDKEYNKWRANQKQLDDILIIGMRF